MTGSYIQNKKSIYKYVDANREKINEYNVIWKHEHRDAINEAQSKKYHSRRACDYEVIAKIFRKILL